jgi:hypothetical protein
MKFSRHMPFKQALNASQARSILPTALSSRELAEIEGDILQYARFSARVRSAEHLAAIDDPINDLVAGRLDYATGRLSVKKFLDGTGYMAPEDERGSLADFASDARINLQLRMGVQMAQGYGYHIQGQDPVLLDAFPARELVRVEEREVPRGQRRGPGGALVDDSENGWPARWNRARAETTEDGATDSASGRMVAIVGHPLWKALSRFGVEHEPFDFNSGMGLEDVDRQDAMALGIIERDTQIFPQRDRFGEALQAAPEIRSERLRGLLEETGAGRFDRDGVFVAAKRKGSR